MRRYNLLFLDEDEFYLNNLVNYIMQEYSKEINAVSISKKEFLESALKNNSKIDLIVSSEGFYEDSKKYLRDSNVILLSNNITDKTEVLAIKKYQSVKSICKKIIDICENTKNINEKETRVISFYSPIGGIGTTSLSLSIAEKTALKGAKVLYISFEESQSIDFYLRSKNRKINFSDVILSIKQREENISEVFDKAVSVYDDMSLYYLSRIDSILDIEEMSTEDIRELIEKITEKKYYDFVFCELPGCFSSKYYYLLKRSEIVFEIIGQDALSAYKTDEMLKQFDDINNFKFIMNKYDKTFEKVIPEIISKNLLPIIKIIPYYKSIDKTGNLKNIIGRVKEFEENLDEIVQELML